MSETMMHAIRYHRHGGPEVLLLESVTRPKPKANEILVRVHAAGVLPIDWKIRQGIIPFPVQFPVIVGSSFAGTILETGEGVTKFQPGQRVFGRSTYGTYAEYTIAVPGQIAVIPEFISFDEASTIPGGATTAWQALVHDAGLKAGQRVLIHGAAGGVGSFAVQIAKWSGAYVIGTAGPRNINFVRGLGADEVIDYIAASFETVVRGVDLVLDTVGGATGQRSLVVLKSGGVLISIAGQFPAASDSRQDVRVMRPSRTLANNQQDLEKVANLMEHGLLEAIVGERFPLREAAKAHVLSETGHGRGRIVLHVVTKPIQEV